MSEDANNITALREHLFAALAGLRDKANPLELDRARAISDVAKTVIESARVEIEYLKLNGGGESEFIDAAIGNKHLPPGILGSRVHRLKG